MGLPGGWVLMGGKQQTVRFEDLDEEDQRRARIRLAHVLETETGYRSGSVFWAEEGEPRPQFDPARTTLTQRREAKVAELAALASEDAKFLGLRQVGERTLRRMAAAFAQDGLVGLADGRWTRELSGHPSIIPEFAEAIRAVHAESLHRSRLSMTTRERLIHQYVREKHGPELEEKLPHRTTLAKVWKEWFGPDGARQRYVRSAAAVEPGGSPVVVSRPGQVVVLDTTPLPVKVLDDVFSEPISVDLTLALDAFTHSLVAFRLTPGSDSSVEVAMLLRDVMLPLPMRPGWGPEMEWPYPGVPAALVAEFAGHPVAGRPFFAPETLTSDHGSVYKNHHLVQVARTLGVTVLPARAMRPTDKASCERAFAGIQSLLLELLLGYRGVDVADRGADPEGDAVWTLSEMEHLIATWIVRIWQNRKLEQYAPAWDPGGQHSPNTLFAAAAARDGEPLQIPEPELYYQLLPVHFVKIHPSRGVKIGGLWYSGPVLREAGPSRRGGAHRGKWAVHRDPRDCREVFFELGGTWHPLRWKGLPDGDDVPAFSDSRIQQVLREAARRGLRPQDDQELLPVLLDMLRAKTPVSAWPSQWTKAERTERARELARARAAAEDRPAAAGLHLLPAAAAPGDLARRNQRAIDADRRRRREEAVATPLAPPLTLGEDLNERSLFSLLSDDEDEGTKEGEVS
ncbi:transposase family protein [Streptomyces europaeiscabiei]|uniref:transposase n=1 Tax=Streptomyces europaeiscabiei TaxID=146819 RepID=UPI00299FCB5B|nr:transposase [Streptomyces europaeiscabiei]MDX3616068.1 transposase [Streptomyces europaeiscabiei]